MRRLSLVSLVAGVALMLAPGNALAATSTSTVGQNFAPNFDCPGDWTALQSKVAAGNSYAVATAGTITSWSFQTGSAAIPELKLKVARPQGGALRFIGEAAAGSQTPNAVNTYPANISVQAGDIIGVHWDNTTTSEPVCTQTMEFDDVNDLFGGDPAVGSSPPPSGAVVGYRLPVSATVTTTTPDHTCKGKKATIVGTNGNDVRSGTPGRDVMVGLGGNDNLSGLGGNDVICGAKGNDTLRGGPGADTLLGQKGNDNLLGNKGNDKLSGKKGNDRLKGAGGNDKLKGGGGSDICIGGKANDFASKCEVEKSI